MGFTNMLEMTKLDTWQIIGLNKLTVRGFKILVCSLKM